MRIRSFLSLSFFLIGFSSFPSAAAENSGIRISGQQPRQEILSHNGVLVSRPRAVDAQIEFLLHSNNIQSLEDYADWLERNISYQKDTDPGRWRDPLETLNKKYGDCKNFTFLSAAVLQILGYQPKILACLTPKQGHAICAFEMNGAFYWFDNATLKKTSARSLPEFIQEMADEYSLLSLLEFDQQKDQWETLFERS